MTLLNLHLGMIGITVNCNAVSVIQHNLSIVMPFESAGQGNCPLPTPIKSTEIQNQEIIRKRQINQSSNSVCSELKQMVTDASILASGSQLKAMYKAIYYGNYLLN
jgi:hypothetical protein